MALQKFSKRLVLLFLSLIVLLNIIFRYPSTPHEIGADSFVMHIYANTIVELGHAPWTFHPLSYFGLYPASYPTGGPMLLASVSSLTGINMEATVLLTSVLLGVFSVFTSFMLAGFFFDDHRNRLIVAFGYSLSPLLLKFTTWTFSTRGMFLVILPLFIWVLLIHRDRVFVPRIRYDILTILFLFALASTHRMFWVAVLLIGVLLGTLIILGSGAQMKTITVKIKKHINLMLMAMLGIQILLIMFISIFLMPSSTSNITETLVSYNTSIFFFVVFMPIFTLLFTYIGRRDKTIRRIGGFSLVLSFISIFLIQYTALDPYRSSWWIRQIAPDFINIDTMTGEIIALGVVLGARIGLLLIPASLGILYYLMKNKLDMKSLFLILSLLVFLPFIHFAMYFHEAMSIIFFLYSSVIILAIWKWNPGFKSKPMKLIKKAIPMGIMIFIVGALIFSAYTSAYRYSNVDEESGYVNYMTDSVYDAALFTKYYGITVDSGLYSARTGAISGELYNVTYDDLVWVDNSGTPEITDLWGWYGFLKNPSGRANLIDDLIPDTIIVIPPSDSNYNDYYMLFASSDTIIVRINNG